MTDYSYENLDHFKAVMKALDYKCEYNKSHFLFSKGNDIFRVRADEIKKNAAFSNERKSSSQIALAGYFDKDRIEDTGYKDKLFTGKNISIVSGAGSEQLIVDHENKICYTSKEFCRNAHRNGFLLDGKGTQLRAGEYSPMMDFEGEKVKLHRDINKVTVYKAYEELHIPDRIMGHTLDQGQKETLIAGGIVLLKDNKASELYLQLDLELNTVRVKSHNSLNIPDQIGGHTLGESDKILIAEGKFTAPIVMFDKEANRYFQAEVALGEDRKDFIFQNVQELDREQGEKMMRAHAVIGLSSGQVEEKNNGKKNMGKDLKNTNAKIAVFGILKDFGKAPYEFNQDNRESYFISVEKPSGEEKTMWGKELEAAVRASNSQIGDNIRVEHKGMQNVTVEVDDRDDNGNLIGKKKIHTHRNEWQIHHAKDYAKEILEAIKEGDFKKVNEIVTNPDYSPSAQLVTEIENLDMPQMKKEGIKALLGVNKEEGKNKTGQRNKEGKQIGKSNIKEQGLKTINTLFQNM